MEIISEFNGLKIYYFKRKLTQNQTNYIDTLIKSIEDNTSLLVEFPPTLDKDYLMLSTLFSMCELKKLKFTVILQNYDKMNEYLKIIKSICEIRRKFKLKSSTKVFPLFERKLVCLNESLLENSSSLDFDFYCTKYTNSNIKDPSKMCNYYSNLKNNESITIEYEHEQDNNFDKLIYSFRNNKQCPFYYFLNNIQQAGIIFTTYSDYFNSKSRNHLSSLIKIEDYHVVFDTCDNIDKNISDACSINIDENLIVLSINQLLKLKELYNEVNDDNNNNSKSVKDSNDSKDVPNNNRNDIVRNINGNGNGIKSSIDIVMHDLNHSHINHNNANGMDIDSDNNFKDIDYCKDKTENEFIFQNHLNYPIREKNLPGNIRKSFDYFNLFTKVLIFIKNKCFLKTKIENFYKLQLFLYNEWIEFRTLKFFFRRLIEIFNTLISSSKFKCDDYYHLSVFCIFITKIAIVSTDEVYLLNYNTVESFTESQKEKKEIFNLELKCMEPSKILNKTIKSFKHCILTSGSLGKIDIYQNLNNLNKICPNCIVKSYNDDSDNKNIYIGSISQSNSNNIQFYGEVLIKLCSSIPDGILCYFSSQNLLEHYIHIWTENQTLDKIMDYKLLFIEEKNSKSIANTIVNYKTACDLGRGGIFFISLRNKVSKMTSFQNHQARGIIFIGFPIETKIYNFSEHNSNQDFKVDYKLMLKNYKNIHNIEETNFLNYDAVRLFSNKFAETISSSKDKKILVILNEKLQSIHVKKYLPEWISNYIHSDEERKDINSEECLKEIKNFLK